MRKIIFIVFLAFVFSSSKQENQNWTNLLEKDLSHWDNYLSFKHQIGYNGQEPKDEHGNIIPPVGFNKPGYDVFSLIEENNEPVLKISGEIYGCVFTYCKWSCSL